MQTGTRDASGSASAACDAMTAQAHTRSFGRAVIVVSPAVRQASRLPRSRLHPYARQALGFAIPRHSQNCLPLKAKHLPPPLGAVDEDAGCCGFGSARTTGFGGSLRF